MRHLREIMVATVMALLVAGTARGESGLKIYISADMEGVVGVVTGEQLGPSGFEYQRAREWMTREVNAAIDAAFEAGVTDEGGAIVRRRGGFEHHQVVAHRYRSLGGSCAVPGDTAL